jgi:hypothetical protein
MFLAETVTLVPPLAWVLIALVVLVVWLGRRNTRNMFSRECPHCREKMRGDASVCPHCQRESEPWLHQDGNWFRRDPAGDWEYLDRSGDGVTRWRKTESAATREP